MGLYVAHRQPGSIEPNDFVIHPVDSSLALLHQLGLETAIPVAGDSNRHLAVLALQHFGRCAIAGLCPLVSAETICVVMASVLLGALTAEGAFINAISIFLQALISAERAEIRSNGCVRLGIKSSAI